ncbi:MAG TPA: chloramphenicol acetyltransferase [Clostridiales bacterium]|nr:chloramphenicol acetyltransferase [Clostridiales bacterium]
MIEVDPSKTSRAQCFSLFTNAPMPMLTVFKTLDVTKAVKAAKKRGVKLNALLCHAVYLATKDIKEMHYLVKDGKLFFSEELSVGLVVKGKDGKLLNCDVPASDDFSAFYVDYNCVVEKALKENESQEDTERVSIGTSAILTGSIDGLVNLYSPAFTNPFLVWSRYESKFFKKILKVSFQFHHAQIDGGEAVLFLENLQKVLNKIS